MVKFRSVMPTNALENGMGGFLESMNWWAILKSMDVGPPRQKTTVNQIRRQKRSNARYPTCRVSCKTLKSGKGAIWLVMGMI